MKRTAADRAEIGLQVIADTITAVDLNEQRKRGADEYSIDGEGTTIDGRRFGALLLALRARDREPMVQSLIVPAAVEYQSSKRYRLLTSKADYTLRFGRLIEQQPAGSGPRSSRCRSSFSYTGGMPAVDRYAEIHASHRWEVPPDFNIAQACCGRWAADRARFALYWEDETGACSAHVLRPAATGEPARQCARALGGVPRRPRRADPAAASARRSSRISPRTSSARSPCRCRSCSAPSARIPLAERAAQVAFVDPQSLPNLAPVATGCRRFAHVVGVAGASGPCVDRGNRCRRRRVIRARRTTPRDRPGDPDLHERHHRAAKGALMPHSACSAISRLRALARRLSAAGDSFWSPADWAWTGGLMDALLPTLYLRPADRRLSRTLRSRARAAADRANTRSATRSCFRRRSS
jgi:hypothetical protein